MRNHRTAEGRKTIGQKTIKVYVHDGLALRTVGISTSDSHLELLEKIATAMKRPNHLVEMGYEAPWSTKIGNKKSLAYLSNEDELDGFWVAYSRFTKKQEGKTQKRRAEVACDIVFRNMTESAPVSWY